MHWNAVGKANTELSTSDLQWNAALSQVSGDGLNLQSTGVGWIVVPYVVSVLPVVLPLLKGAAVGRDCAWRILASQEHIVIRVKIH